MACGCWIRDADNVASFRCGDESGIDGAQYLCDKCLDALSENQESQQNKNKETRNGTSKQTETTGSADIKSKDDKENSEVENVK